MCARFVLRSPPESVRALFRYRDQPNFPPRYNIAPTQPIGIVRLEHGERRFVLVRWGLIPSWAKDPKKIPLLINARAEGVAEKPAFRGAFRHRRCVVPADGWYEWQATTGRSPKRPFFVRPVVEGPIAFAGLWEHFLAPDGSEIETAAILTTDANATLAGMHDRMPVILAPNAIETWLDPASERQVLGSLLRPAPEPAFAAVPVATAVNSVSNDGPSLLEPESTNGQAATVRDKQLKLF